jgi:RNA polymerase sigma-70 factor (ECF subfamily)
MCHSQNSFPSGSLGCSCVIDSDSVDEAVERYLERLAQATEDAEARRWTVRELLGAATKRILSLCNLTLSRHYPRLTKGPLNLQPEELLGAVVERLIKALQTVRPAGVREFFALAMKHVRWELNGLARGLDAERCEPFAEEVVADETEEVEEPFSPLGQRILDAIDGLPRVDREIFNLVRLGGMTQPDAAQELGISERTVQRRLRRIMPHLWGVLGGLEPPQGTELQRNRTLRPNFAGAQAAAGERSPRRAA